jgi:phosphate starvation-inducible PhoH-like protein
MTISTKPEHAIVVVPTSTPMVSIVGARDELIKVIENAFPDVVLMVRGNEITIDGSLENVTLIQSLISEMIVMLRTGQGLTPEAIERSITMLRADVRPADVLASNILSSRGKTIRAKTLNQKKYVDAIDAHTVVFGIGPAGTGKTYLAVAKAVQALQSKQVSRIILTRPAVEAGERLGFLPGTLSEKIDPYLRPLYDALQDMLEPEEMQRCLERNVIEIAPLAYMRGRTLAGSFIVLDEAQNTTTEQMFMFLTRLGLGSKCVITGDQTQIDLPSNRRSGLVEALQALREVAGVGICHFDDKDVVRHELVASIVRAYRSHRGTGEPSKVR